MQKINHYDDAYPTDLKNLPDAPKQLFYEGDFTAIMSMPRLAIVGSRKVTPYGRLVTERLAREAAEQGIAIISGLALGIDGIAHQAALDAKGRTMAVLPTGLDNISPRTNYQLAMAMLKQGGALVTEYGTDIAPFKVNFVARNRIVTALSDAILITEAAQKSGSLHTASFALEQGKTVMAVPGNITSEQSSGTNNLIKSGAIPVTEIRDILAAMGLERMQKSRQIFGDTREETMILQQLQSGITDSAELLYKSALEPHIFNQSLTMLEISGKIRPLGAGALGAIIMGLFGWLFGFPSAAEKKMCRNKVRYRTYIDAQLALKRINPGNAKRNKPNRYYKCPHCSGYHLTKSRKQ